MTGPNHLQPDDPLNTPGLTVVIPTYGRDEVLLATIDALHRLDRPPDEILILDQTQRHAVAVEEALAALDRSGAITWLRLPKPSIPGAMNRGLLAAHHELVLFLDDDILPHGELIGAHLAAHRVDANAALLVAGQVLQPGEAPAPLSGSNFAFRSSIPQEIVEVMAGNLSVTRSFALSIGGFDEQFVGAAYRFEADFAARARNAGAHIKFVPNASIFHLREGKGGTRSFGSHLTTIRPAHAVGEYYYLLRHHPPGALRRFLGRPIRAVTTRHHLRHPWWIPVTLLAELSGMAWAAILAVRGPRLASARAVTAKPLRDTQ